MSTNEFDVYGYFFPVHFCSKAGCCRRLVLSILIIGLHFFVLKPLVKSLYVYINYIIYIYIRNYVRNLVVFVVSRLRYDFAMSKPHSWFISGFPSFNAFWKDFCPIKV